MSFKSLSITAVAALSLFAGAAHAQNLFANGGFETAPTGAAPPPGGSGYFAANWLFAPTGNPVQRSTTTFRSGSASALVTVPNGFGGSTMFQNSVDHGGLAPIDAGMAGMTTNLSFWARGDVSTTGNILFSLRYLAPNGGILGNSGNIFFQNQINPNTWSNITFAGAAIPVGTAAVFLEINTAVGPLLDGRPNAVFIDDLSLTAVPEPGTYALMLAGLACVGGIAARRRRAA